MADQNNNEKIIVFSDLHISKFTGFFHEEAFTNGIMSIANEVKHHPNTILLNLGDITDQGTFEDYIYAKTLITGAFITEGVTDAKIHYIPGNHDFRNIGREIWEDHYGERHFFIDTTENGGNLVILGIDSVEPDANTGRIGSRGRKAILDKLAPYPEETVKILCFHHHLLPIPHAGRERSMTIDAGDLLPVLWESGVDVVINGHRHYPNLFNISNGEKRILLINNGTFSSHKTRGRAGHVYLSLDITKTKIQAKFKGSDKYSLFQIPETYLQPLIQGKIPSYQLSTKPSKILTKICQFGCTHFTPGSDFQEKIYNQGIKLVLDEQPTLIVHCGSLTNDAFPEDYALAKNSINTLRETNVPIVLVPGTRDLRPFGVKLWMEQIGPLDPKHDFKESNLHVFGISTGRESSGHIGRSHLSLLEDDLDKYRDNRLFIIVMHHSCLPIPKSTFERTVKNAGDSLDFFTRNEIPLVLSGLEHFSTSLQIEKTVFVNAGTFSSKKIKSEKMNTFNVLTIWDNGTLKIEEIEIHSSFRHLLGTYYIPIPANLQ